MIKLCSTRATARMAFFLHNKVDMDAYVHAAVGAAIGVITKNTAKLVFPDLEVKSDRKFSSKLAHAVELATVYGAGFTGAMLSHVFMDMLPHGDFLAYNGLFLPDSLWMVRELLAVVFVLFLAMVFLRRRSRLAAFVSAVGGVLLDLDNLAISLGWIERSQALSPSHSGVWPHGQNLGTISFVLEIGLFLAAMGVLAAVSWRERSRVVRARRVRSGALG